VAVPSYCVVPLLVAPVWPHYSAFLHLAFFFLVLVLHQPASYVTSDPLSHIPLDCILCHTTLHVTWSSDISSQSVSHYGSVNIGHGSFLSCDWFLTQHTTNTVIETDVTNDRDPFWLMVLDWPLLPSVFGWQSNLYSSLYWNNQSQYCFILLCENKSSVREDRPACRLTSYLAVWFAPKQVVRLLAMVVSGTSRIECTRRPPCLSAHQLFSGVVCAKTGCSISHCTALHCTALHYDYDYECRPRLSAHSYNAVWLAPREVVAFTTVLLYFFRRFSLFVLSIIRISINTIIIITFFFPSSNYYRHCNFFIVMVTVANGICSEYVLVISSQLEIRYWLWLWFHCSMIFVGCFHSMIFILPCSKNVKRRDQAIRRMERRARSINQSLAYYLWYCMYPTGSIISHAL
jgi:hypothetical protein